MGLPGKAGKAKGKKAQMCADVLPSPRGKRVIPQVTVEMKAEAEKKIRKKIKVILSKLNKLGPVKWFRGLSDQISVPGTTWWKKRADLRP